MSRRVSRVLVLLGLGLVGLLLQASVAGAVVQGKSPKRSPKESAGTNTQLVLTNTGHGGSVSGFIAKPGTGFNPVTDPYPTSYPTTDWSPKEEGFAGIIHAEPPGGGTEISLYCIDIDTLTYPGVTGYALGTWDAASVPNVGWVARLLNEYYPSTDEPKGLTDLNQKAAAVQAAIWFFSDRFALTTSSPLYATVKAIVQHIQSAGTVVTPPPPSLTLTPSLISGPPGSVLGPFTVTTDQDTATVTAAGGNMFTDGGATALPDPAHVKSGTKIWVGSEGPSVAVLQATAEAKVPTGNVYLYDGNSGDGNRQKLILAATAKLRTIVNATAEFLRPGSLVVKKTIAGPAAGLQGPVVVKVDCDDHKLRGFTIDAHAGPATRSFTFERIPAGSVCTVTETADGTVGSASKVGVVVEGDGQQVTIPVDRSETVDITDTYHQFGSLLVTKTIAGAAAAERGSITIHTVCDGVAPADWVIPPGAPADQAKQYDDIPAPGTCTVTETSDGHTATVSVVVTPNSQTVSVGVGEIAHARILDTYGLAPGQLEVTKTIAGPLAGLQGTVVVHTACNGTPLAPDLVIGAGAPAGDHSQLYSGIPTPATCVVTETEDGHTSTVPVAVTGSPSTVSMAPGAAGAAHITDSYGSAPGSLLLVTKSIAGPLAGQQGPIVIRAVCNGTARSPDFVIGAGAKAGSVSQSFDGIPAGSLCTVTETADGGTTTVAAIVAGSGQTVAVPAGTVVPVSLVDTYGQPLGELEDVVPPLGGSGPFQPIPGYLKVIKTMTGPAARQHGPISILVDCGPAHAFAFLIPAHVTGTVSRVFPDLPRGTRCTVTETENGHTNTVSVLRTRKRRHARVPAKGGASVRFTDVFSPIVVISGPPPGLG